MSELKIIEQRLKNWIKNTRSWPLSDFSWIMNGFKRIIEILDIFDISITEYQEDIHQKLSESLFHDIEDDGCNYFASVTLKNVDYKMNLSNEIASEFENIIVHDFFLSQFRSSPDKFMRMVGIGSYTELVKIIHIDLYKIYFNNITHIIKLRDKYQKAKKDKDYIERLEWLDNKGYNMNYVF